MLHLLLLLQHACQWLLAHAHVLLLLQQLLQQQQQQQD